MYPTPLYRSITEDDGFKRWLISTIKDGAGDPNDTTIMNLLNYLAFDHPVSGDVFLDTFNFLHDKIKSTQVFDAYILSILSVDNTPFDVPVDTLSVSEYLTHVQDNITRMLRAIDTLNRKFRLSKIRFSFSITELISIREMRSQQTLFRIMSGCIRYKNKLMFQRHP